MSNIMYIIKKPLFSVVVLTIFLLTPSAFAMEEFSENSAHQAAKQVTTFENITEDNKREIVILAAHGSYPGKLQLVCKDWKKFIDETTKKDKNGQYSDLGPVWKTYLATYPPYAPIFNGVLSYRSDHESDKGTKTWKFSELSNPFKDTFDLSEYGEASVHFIITTDISSFFKNKVNDRSKLLILITPYALVSRTIASSAKYLDSIMPKWNADISPIGIFWRISGSDFNLYDALITQNPYEISKNDLFTSGALMASKRSDYHGINYQRFNDYHQLYGNNAKISCSFVNQNKND